MNKSSVEVSKSSTFMPVQSSSRRDIFHDDRHASTFVPVLVCRSLNRNRHMVEEFQKSGRNIMRFASRKNRENPYVQCLGRNTLTIAI